KLCENSLNYSHRASLKIFTLYTVVDKEPKKKTIRNFQKIRMVFFKDRDLCHSLKKRLFGQSNIAPQRITVRYI
ncbi:hypothetical protein E5340_10760, partial [Ligilactobacillus murinus]